MSRKNERVSVKSPNEQVARINDEMALQLKNITINYDNSGRNTNIATGLNSGINSPKNTTQRRYTGGITSLAVQIGRKNGTTFQNGHES